ncbi:hypothetical protein VC83_06528 [Pseudogymnoascus destructans]|uniref:RING-type domain-containing protein n=2 Tax=Pseudogymnoascus destructans TaxID=655981 RepID=L8FW54_PSED2|nr:uncharacterized protein VC83_06528 [Pseudogymnoascus destructans]ELR05180.1 hypothetical protein GMDG_07221 [Pseudogymnoascus destructans 20631-21]OAF58346.1 hypothetical protein VC83_06528 [Pseudogymnoascus destructans]
MDDIRDDPVEEDSDAEDDDNSGGGSSRPPVLPPLSDPDDAMEFEPYEGGPDESKGWVARLRREDATVARAQWFARLAWRHATARARGRIQALYYVPDNASDETGLLERPDPVPVGDTCAVCMMDLGAEGSDGEDVRRLPCGHLFHYECILRWLYNGNCPVCRHSKEVHDKDVHSKEVHSKDVHGKEVNSKEVNSKEVNSKEVNSKEVNSKEVNSKEVNSKEANSKRVGHRLEQRGTGRSRLIRMICGTLAKEVVSREVAARREVAKKLARYPS